MDDPPEGAAKVRAWAAAAGIRTSKAFAGEKRSYGPLSWDVLWPDPGSPVLQASAGASSDQPPSDSNRTSAKRSSGSHKSRGSKSGSKRGSSHGGEEGSAPNNSSVVLHVSADTPDGPVTILLTGDIEPPAQQAILAAHPDPSDLVSDVFKVPHHGSAYQDPDLVAAVRPLVSIISVGVGNTYGHPADRTLSLAASTGAKVFRTDRDGAVAVVGPASRLRLVVRKQARR